MKDRLSYSRVRNYTTCSQRYDYWYRQGLRPKGRSSALSIGVAFHAGIEAALRWKQAHLPDGGPDAWNPMCEAGIDRISKLEDLPLEDASVAASITSIAINRLDLWSSRWETVCDGQGVPMIEYEFEVPLRGWAGFRGFIDWVVIDKHTGGMWLWDWKTRKSFRSEETEHVQPQFAIYQHAMGMLGYPIRGTVTAQVRSKMMHPPKLTKKGEISRAKPSCDWQAFQGALIHRGLDVADYADMEAKCSTWVQLARNYRSRAEVKGVWDDLVVPASEVILRNDKPIRARGDQCSWCQFSDLCMAETGGYDANNQYEKAEKE